MMMDHTPARSRSAAHNLSSKLRTKCTSYPKVCVPVLKFKNFNFKLETIELLIYEKNLPKPKFNV